MLTKKEKEIILNLANTYNDFYELCKNTPESTNYDDEKEFAQYIHILQRMISCRVARRTNPDILRNRM